MKIQQLFETTFSPLVLATNGDWAARHSSYVVITDIPNSITDDQLRNLFQLSFPNVEVYHAGSKGEIPIYNIQSSEFHKVSQSVAVVKQETHDDIFYSTWQQFVEVAETKVQDDFMD